jgi:23S rRNA pseudouridine1911/1915/1917 synthase
MWNELLDYVTELGDDGWRPPELPDEPEWTQAPPAVQEMLRQMRTKRLWDEEGLSPRPCLLHRLDKDTSGIVALARTERSRRHIVRQFNDHTIMKRYLAVVQEGAATWTKPRTDFAVTKRLASGDSIAVDRSFLFAASGDEEYLLDGPIQRDPDDRRRCIVGEDGQQAITQLKVCITEHGYALLEVHPITGRTHQIRAHLAALGYAIVGDQLYAGPEISSQATLSRQFLHAYSLSFRRYPDNVLATFHAPLAEDLRTWLTKNFRAALGYME